MNTHELAAAFVNLLKEGRFEEAGHHESADIVSIEAMGDEPVHRGKHAVMEKRHAWNSAHEVHSSEAIGPYVNGDQFAVRFAIDVTNKQSGQRMQMDEVALYTVRDGKVVEERFFYGR